MATMLGIMPANVVPAAELVNRAGAKAPPGHIRNTLKPVFHKLLRTQRFIGTAGPKCLPYQGLDHFGLTVKDIDAVAAEIKAKGVEFTKEPTTIRPGVRICFIRGPQGISIELLERDKKYA